MKKIIDCNVNVRNYRIVALFEHKYNDGNRCILAERVFEDGEKERTPISVNIPNEAYNLIGEGEFFLKNWSEAEEAAKALIDSGVIIDSGSSVQTGFIRAPIVSVKRVG